MNTIKKRKVNTQRSKLFQRQTKSVKKIKKEKIKTISRSALKPKVQKAKKVAQLREFVQSVCQFKIILERIRELALRFESAAKGAFYIDGIRVKKNQTQNIDEIQNILEERAVEMVEEMRQDLNQRRVRLCPNCLMAQCEFFKRTYRRIIYFTFSNMRKFGNGALEIHKLKKSYFNLVAAQVRRQVETLEQFLTELQQQHKNPNLIVNAFLIDGPKQLVFPNAFQRHQEYLPELADAPHSTVYQFVREGQTMLDYLTNLQVNLEHQRMGVLNLIDMLGDEHTNSQSESQIQVN